MYFIQRGKFIDVEECLFYSQRKVHRYGGNKSFDHRGKFIDMEAISPLIKEESS